MNNKKKMSMNTKLLLMAVGIASVGLFIGIVGIIMLNTINKNVGKIYNDNVLGFKYVEQIESNILIYRKNILNLILETTDAAMDEVNKSMQENEKAYFDGIEKYKKTISSTRETELMKSLTDGFNGYKTIFINDLVPLARANNFDGSVKIVNTKLSPYYSTNIAPYLAELIKLNDDLANKAYKDSNNAFIFSLIIIITIILAGFTLSILLAFFISRGISKPISNIVANLSGSSEQISISSEQLSESAQSIANGATEQAASIEETTSSMEELASMVKQNVENAKEATILAQKSSDSSEVGFTKMENMLDSINSISKSSDDIQNVINIIDDIAFQTNMLALNAAVEAARAGEAGMGFAVVADEVKNLANRSSENAKETAKMIKETITKIGGSNEIAKQLSEMFKEILTGSKKVNEMVKEVETASRQQDEGISQVNKAIIQFDTVVQQNASTSEETASAAEELQSQVGNLNEIVNELYVIVTGEEYNNNNGKSKSSSKTKTAAPKQLQTKKEVHLISESNEKKEKKDNNAHQISFEDDEDFRNL